MKYRLPSSWTDIPNLRSVFFIIKIAPYEKDKRFNSLLFREECKNWMLDPTLNGIPFNNFEYDPFSDRSWELYLDVSCASSSYPWKVPYDKCLIKIDPDPDLNGKLIPIFSDVIDAG